MYEIRVSPNVKHSLEVITMCQYKFISETNVPLPVEDIGNHGHYACVVAEDRWKNSVASLLFFKFVTALKK